MSKSKGNNHFYFLFCFWTWNHILVLCLFIALFFFGSLSCVTITIQSDWAKSSLWKLHLCLSQSGSLPSPWWNHMLLWYGFLVHLLFPRDVDILCKFMFEIYSLKRNSYAALQSWILTNLSSVLEFWGCYQMAFLAVGLAPLQIFVLYFSFCKFLEWDLDIKSLNLNLIWSITFRWIIMVLFCTSFCPSTLVYLLSYYFIYVFVFVGEILLSGYCQGGIFYRSNIAC